ncbi:DNA polymerase III subunit delta [Aestuariimicrobium kwangyangense]|uniref:DNA polymerase III subunit delta n=1 Tax=Aestuariimicrobium kwangyangense TaxID=396389 RepID=UPI0003B72951|nr:DNA polymerase III subunit delta [Aestuariimicrobium kwangyangense]
MTMGRALLVTGPEALLAERHVAARVRSARKQAPEADLHQVEASSVDAGTFAELTGGSLFASASIVVLNDVSGLDQSLFDLVAATAADPSEELCLVMTHPGGVKGKGLLDKLKKAKVETIEAPAIKTWELGKFVENEARHAKLRLEAGAAQALVDAIGNDPRAIAAAVVQLCDDLVDQTLTVEAVQTYFGGRAEVTSFAVADDVMAGRTGDALEKLRWALATGVAPVLVTSALANSLRGLGKYHDLRSSRLNDGEVARQIGVPPWKVKDLTRLSRSWSPRAIAQAVVAVAEADGAVKGMAADADFALEQMLLALDRARTAR